MTVNATILADSASSETKPCACGCGQIIQRSQKHSAARWKRCRFASVECRDNFSRLPETICEVCKQPIKRQRLPSGKLEGSTWYKRRRIHQGCEVLTPSNTHGGFKLLAQRVNRIHPEFQEFLMKAYGCDEAAKRVQA